MLQVSLQEIFPELTKLTANPLSSSQFASLPYFSRYISLLSQKQCKIRAQKSLKSFKLAKIQRGTVIYTSDEYAQHGYILLDGCVKIVKKKNSREKTQTFPNHYSSTQQQKYKYLYNQFKIPRNKAQNLLDVFYEEKFQYKYLPFHTIYNREEFGFGQMVRNTSRTQTAIAVEQSQVLIIDKNSFDEYLRDFQQNKQNALIYKILYGCRQEIIDEMQPKMLPIMNTALLIKQDNEDLIYDQTDYPTNLYFIVEGQVEIRKKTVLTVPKKYMKHQIKDPIQKQLMVKIYKAGKGSLFGEEQIFSSRKQRSFTVFATLNDTIILKIDQNSFLKAISDFTGYEKMLIQNAVFKKASAEQSYEKQYKKIYSSFINQYEAYDSSKKQKMLSNLMKQDEDKNQMFEAFAPEGVFFRDTFQKLQGFQQAQKSPNKKNSIKRLKQKSNVIERNSIPFLKQNHSVIQIQTNAQKFSSHQVAEKLLFSPKRTINVADFYADDLQKKQEAQNMKTQNSIQRSQKKGSVTLTKKQKSLGKFQQIQKDEAIFKRVLIKNGLYPVDKKIDKSKSVKPLIHYNFDQVVKQCISRKNQALRRSSKQKQDQIIVESYQRSVMSLKKKPSTQSTLKFSRYTTPCKGTEQLKKRMQSYHNLGSGRLSDMSQVRKKSIVSKIEDCIGVNQKPKSDQISYRANFGRSTMFATHQKSPERIVLLNHMMKPIIYFKSNELPN